MDEKHSPLEHIMAVEEELKEIKDFELNETEHISDPLLTDGNSTNAKESQTKGHTKKSLIDDIVDAILPRIKHPVGIIFDVAESGETKSNEELEKSLLKRRIIARKTRFLHELEMPEKVQAERERATAQSRLWRQKRKAMETPEQEAARKQRQRIIVATSRKRTKELESSEQRAERMAKNRETRRLGLHKKYASETLEERAARRKIEREKEQKYRSQRIINAKTGKIQGLTRAKKTPSPNSNDV